jgi:8-amino-7-oxononanoate synthase
VARRHQGFTLANNDYQFMISALLQERIATRLHDLAAAGLERRLQLPQGIDVASNDYLGLARHPQLIAQMQAAVQQEGCGATASRLLRGERELFQQLESQFADFKGTAAALYFSSGYLANLAVMTTFVEAEDVVFSDQLNHASLIDGLRLARAPYQIFPHNDRQALRQMLAETKVTGQKFVVTESLFSMDGDEAPLADYAEICAAHQAALIVDEAHAVGIYGQQGSGLIEETGANGGVWLSMNAAGKALGAAGALVAGAGWAIEYLKQRARPLIFSTAPPPAIAAAILAALAVIKAEPARRQQLQHLAGFCRQKLQAAALPLLPGRSQIVPVVIGDNQLTLQIAQQLQQAGFDIRAIRPPTVAVGSARLRLSLNVNLSEAVLAELATLLGSWWRKQR